MRAVTYLYFECPDCQYNMILREDITSRAQICPLCAEDCGHDIWMYVRQMNPDDTAEYDGRDHVANP